MLMAPVATNREKPAFHVGVLLLPGFELLAFAAFVDTLRLAAEEQDGSGPVDCRWTVVSPTRTPVRASCGAELVPWETLESPERFDYIAVVGGGWNAADMSDPIILRWIRAAAAASVRLIGLGAGTFALLRAGVMHGRRTCISASRADEFAREFPNSTPVFDQWFTTDWDRITCPEGVAAADVAALLVKRHCGEDGAGKSLHRRMITRMTPPDDSRPISTTSLPLEHERLHRAVALIERRMCEPPSISELANHAHLSPRHLQRLFKARFGLGPQEFSRRVRLRYGLSLLNRTDRKVADIADACGFRQTHHFCRQFKALFGSSPLQARVAAPKEFRTKLEESRLASPA